MGDIIGHFFYYLNSWQRDFNAEISSAFRGLDDSGIYGVLFLLGLSFLYGVIHAIGPGHGKGVVAAYFLNHKKDYLSAFKIGYMIAIIHAAMALLITLVIYFLLDVVFTKTFNATTNIMYQVSGGMIILVGFYMLWNLMRPHSIELPQKGKELAIAFSIGIAPCPGVMTVLLFSILLKKMLIGIAAAAVMSFGMGLTISLFGIFANRISKEGGRSQKVLKTLSFLSPVFIITLGWVLLFW